MNAWLLLMSILSTCLIIRFGIFGKNTTSNLLLTIIAAYIFAFFIVLLEGKT